MDKKGEIVVLTGASGCLGHHTLKLLVSRDDLVDEIRCLDLRDPQDSMMKIIDEEQSKLIVKSRRKKEIKWIKGDVCDVNVVERTLTDADCVIHCAAKIQVWRRVENDELQEFEMVNVKGTETLLKASIKLGVSKFIHVSSFEAFFNIGSMFYATEVFLQDVDSLLFGHSGRTKREAERKVRRYNNSKLERQSRCGNDSLRTVVIRFPMFYGEYEKYFVSRVLTITKFLGGEIHRLNVVWARQQPIYVGNAAWSLILAKRIMDKDPSVAGEDFNVTDLTPILDPFEFVKPYIECVGMKLTNETYRTIPLLIYLNLVPTLNGLLGRLNPFAWFKNRKEKGSIQRISQKEDGSGKKSETWYDYITLQAVLYMCTSSFLNGCKASIRFDYDPIVGPDESQRRTINWLRENWKS